MGELPFFTNLLILLVTARLFGELFERMRQPSMIGEIIAGMILGPSVLNLIHRTEEIKVISELGVFLLVILAGLEIRIDDILKSMRGRNMIISLLAFALPLAGGFAVGHFFGQQVMTSVFIGLCVAITALPVSIRILMDLGQINSAIGKRIISVAIFDDVLALTVLGVLLNVKDTDMSLSAVMGITLLSLAKLIAFIVVLSLAYLFINRLIRKGDVVEMGLNPVLEFLRGKESLFAIFFAFVLLFSTITENLGFHFIIGAFFAAMLISDTVIGKDHLKTVESTVSSLAMGFLAPIFFAGIGLEFNVGSIENLWLLAGVIAVSYLTKIFGGFLGCSLAGLDRRTSWIVGIGLNARGIMELVIANIAYKAGLISTEVFSILVIMGVLTTLTTPLMLKRGFGRLAAAEAPAGPAA